MVDVPTVVEVKARHPEFSSVDDTRIDLFISDATRQVDDTWLTDDQKPAIIALTCHLMSLEGEPALTASLANGGNTSGSANGKFLKRRKVGDTENEFAESAGTLAAAQKSSTASQAGYRSTPYGARFLKLLQLNHSGVRVV